MEVTIPNPEIIQKIYKDKTIDRNNLMIYKKLFKEKSIKKNI